MEDAELNGKGRGIPTRVSVLEEKVRLISLVLKGVIWFVLSEVVIAILAYIVRK